MKNILFISFLTCLILPVYAQKENRGIEYKYKIESVINAPSIYWYGFDVSNSHMLDFAKFKQGEIILPLIS